MLSKIADREEDLCQSLKTNSWGKPKKPELCINLVVGTNVESKLNGKYILNGGAPLHKFKWVEGETYQLTIDRDIKYVNSRF